MPTSLQPDGSSSRSETPTTSRRRLWIGVRTSFGLVLCAGTLWWIVHTVLQDNRAAKEAIRAIGSANPSARVDAILELQTSGLGESSIAIPPLVKALRDADARVRAAACAALGQIGAEAIASESGGNTVRDAVTALLYSLRDPEPGVRAAAANTLGYLMASGKVVERVDLASVVATLIEGLSERDADYRLATLRALSAVALVSPGGPPEELATALEDESPENRAAAVAAIVSFRRGLDPWIPRLFEIMEHDAPAVREACERAMARIRTTALSTESVPVLTAVLRSENPRARAVTCSLLMQFGSDARAAVPELIATARHKQERPAQGAPSDPDPPNVNNLAIQALGRIAPQTESATEAIIALRDILRVEDRSTWNTAVYALEQFGHSAELAVPELIRGLHKATAGEDTMIDGYSAARALGKIAPGTPAAEQSIAALIEALAAGPPHIRYAVALALGEFGAASARAIPDLIRMLKNSSESEPSNADGAAFALGRIAPGTPLSSEAVAALGDALQMKSSMTRYAAAFALRNFGRESVSATGKLRALERDPADIVRRAAAETLAELARHGEMKRGIP
jgi:HEAT repeat protein